MSVIGTDLLLTSTGDLDVSQNDLQNVRSVSQAVGIALRSVAGEWFLNINSGIPYWEQVFNIKNPDLNLVKSLFRSAILAVDGVNALESLTVTLNSKTRQLTVNFGVDTTDGTAVGISQVAF